MRLRALGRITQHLSCLCFALQSLTAAATGPTAQQEALLRRADVGAAAPSSFRALLCLRTPDRLGGGRIEVWRSGEVRTLVRFLDPGERGKYLLYVDNEVWFLSPGSRRPVKLPSSFRLRGSATLDDVLGRHFARDYRILSLEQAEHAGQALVVYQLEPHRARAPYARVSYVVQLNSARPVRAEFRLRSGRLATVLEFLEWTPGETLRPRRLAVRDELHGGAVTDVEILELEERAVPAGLFDRDDGAARGRLRATLSECPAR